MQSAIQKTAGSLQSSRDYILKPDGMKQSVSLLPSNKTGALHTIPLTHHKPQPRLDNALTMPGKQKLVMSRAATKVCQDSAMC